MSAGEFHTGHDDVDVVLMVQIEEADAQRPFAGVDAIAVRAIIALSRAGSDLMTMAVHARNRDVEQLSKRAHGQLNQARAFMVELVEERRARRQTPAQYCPECGHFTVGHSATGCHAYDGLPSDERCPCLHYANG